MMLNHKVSLICCILIIVATEIQCSLRWSGVRFNSTTHMRFAKEAQLTLGIGAKPNYFPVIEYRADYDPHPVLRCAAHIRTHDRCNFTLHLSEGTEQVAIMKAYQFSDTKLAVAWIEIADEKLFDSHVRVTSIDLVTCLSIDIFNTSAIGMVEFHPDGFELIDLSDRHRTNISSTSFDVNGREIAKLTSSVSSDVLDIFPASTKSPSKGLFISTFDDNTLGILYTSGKEIKRLVNVGNQRDPSNAISYADDTTRAICWINQLDLYDVASRVCECAQYDQLGNELWQNRTQCDGYYPFAVCNLKGGGVLLLSYQRSTYDEVRITEMRPRQEALKASVKVRDGPERWNDDSMKVMDYNEVDRTFTMYWVVAPKRTVTYTDLAFAKFSFPSKGQ